MVERTSQETQFSAGQAVQQQQSGAGYQSPDYNKYSRTIEMPGQEGGSSSDRLLDTILGIGSQVAQTKITIDREEAYLKGVAKAGTIQNENELEGSILTRDWQVAGYRDTMGRVASADNEAKIAADMVEMRKKSPAEFEEYMAQRRAEMMPQFEGMSREARKSLFAQQLLNERAQIKKHGVEHTKYIIDTKTKAASAVAQTQFNGLDRAKGDMEVYQPWLDAAQMAAYDVVRDPSLPDEVKGNIIHEYAQLALAKDHQLLYNKMKDTLITLPNGEQGTLFHMIPPEKLPALDGKYRESLERTKAITTAAYAQRTGLMWADITNPNTPPIQYDEFASMMAEGVKNGYYNTPEKQAAAWEKYAEHMVKKTQGNGLAQAFLSGNTAFVAGLNKAPSDAAEAFVAQQRMLKVPENKLIGTLFSVGNPVTGVSGMQAAALTKAGELMEPVIANLRSVDGKIDANSAGVVAETVRQLEAATANGNAAAYSQFYQKMSPEAQVKFTYYKNAIKANGGNPEMALVQANTLMDNESKLTPQQRAERQRQRDAENLKFADEIGPRGIVSSGVTWLRQFLPNWAGGDVNARNIEVLKLPIESQHRIAQIMAPAKLATIEELNTIRSANPEMPIEDAGRLAISRVQARTIHTAEGMIVLEAGTNPQKFFGVPANTGLDRIGAAIDKHLRPNGDNRIAFQAQTNGQLVFQEYKWDGTLIRPGLLNPKELGGIMQTMEQAEVSKFNRERGQGVKSTGNIPIAYNGLNSAGVDPAWMLDFRKNLVTHEGVVDTPMRDLSGQLDKKGNPIMVVGAGVASHTPYYPKVGPDGKVPKAELERSFNVASDASATAAARMMKETGRTGKEAFQFFGELAYQSGNSFDKSGKPNSYPAMMKAIVAGDYPAAKAALEKSPAWVQSGDGARRKHYDALLKAMMKG